MFRTFRQSQTFSERRKPVRFRTLWHCSQSQAGQSIRRYPNWKKEEIDFLLALGGGSVIDTAKAVAYGLAEPEHDVWELFQHTRIAKKCLSLGSILTIAAAGSETSKGCVITNEKTGEKRAYAELRMPWAWRATR